MWRGRGAQNDAKLVIYVKGIRNTKRIFKLIIFFGSKPRDPVADLEIHAEIQFGSPHGVE